MAAYDFPDTAGRPSDGSFTYTAPDGTIYEWNGYAWQVPDSGNPGGGGGGNFEIPTQALPPAGAADGDMFWCTDDGRLYIYYEDADTSQWVDASPDNTSEAVDSYWEKSGSTLSPIDTGDSVDIGSGNITLNAVTGGITASGDVIAIASPGTQSTQHANGFFSSYRAFTGSQSAFRAFDTAVSSTDPTFTVRSNGSAFFGGDIPNNPNILLDAADGSAQFAGTVFFGLSGDDSLKSSIGIGPYVNGGRYSTLQYNPTNYTTTPNIGNWDTPGSTCLLGQGITGEVGTLRLVQGKGGRITFHTDISSFNPPERVSIEKNGNLLIGGTLPASPNITLKADGSAVFKGTVTSNGKVLTRNVELQLEADDDTKYTATTNEDGEQTLVYNGAVLDVKERIQNVISRMDAIEANEVTDDATDSALLTLVASLSSRLDERDATIAALTTRITTLEIQSNGGN